MQIKRLQVELTDKCNARCPMCTRVFACNLNTKEISLSDFRLFFPKSFIADLEFVLFCGNFGEPTLCHDIIPILTYLFDCNENLEIKINTNGDTRGVEFWTELGELFTLYKSTGSAVSFSIDGLEDTNHIYRRGVKWTSLMRNVDAYIKAGALAEWSFIPFKHNQHQFKTIKQLHKELGFVKTNIQQSRRFDQWEQQFYKYEINGQIHYLEPPDSEYFIQKKKHKKCSSLQEKCLLYANRELYVDVQGNVLPCCWYGNSARSQSNPDTSLYFNSIDTIIDREYGAESKIKSTWSNPYSLCNMRCWVLE